MKVTAFVSTRQIGQKAASRSGCAIALFAAYPDGRCQARRMTFGLGDTALNLAALQALRLVFLSIVGVADAIEIFTDNRYAAGMLEKSDGIFRANPSANADVVLLLRDFIGKVPASVRYRKFDSSIGAECAMSARDVAVYQSAVDGGTKEFTNAAAAGLQEEA